MTQRRKRVNLDLPIFEYINGKYRDKYFGFDEDEMIDFLRQDDNIKYAEIRIRRAVECYFEKCHVDIRDTNPAYTYVYCKSIYGAICQTYMKCKRDVFPEIHFIVQGSDGFNVVSTRDELKMFLGVLYHGDLPSNIIEMLTDYYYGVKYEPGVV